MRPVAPLAFQKCVKGYAEARGDLPQKSQRRVGARSFDLREGGAAHAALCGELIEGKIPLLAQGAQSVGHLSSERGRADRQYTLRVSRGRMSIEEQAAPEADARISGPEREWVKAFGEDAASADLDVDGDRRLAEALLGGLAAEELRTAAVA